MAVDEIGGFSHTYNYGNDWELKFDGNFEINDIEISLQNCVCTVGDVWVPNFDTNITSLSKLFQNLMFSVIVFCLEYFIY